LDFTLYDQTMTFLWSFVLGAAVTVTYIFMEVAREISPPCKLLVFAEDITFTFIVSALNFFFAVARTHGYIRWYVIAAQIIVFVLIYFTLGKLLKKCFGIFFRAAASFRAKISLFFVKKSHSMYDMVKKLKK